MPTSSTTTGVVYGCQAPSAPSAYSTVSTPEPASVAATATVAWPMYAPSASWSPSTVAEVSGAVVSSPPPPSSVTVRTPFMAVWPGIVQW
ncbi:hypothetical protein SAMN04883147_103775 [Streptomyces sp. DpondAA-F4]|nr:hypothetical protein SAMN04883147_103775 [Streptomyces sp. DpondAA-F4]